MFYIFIIFLKVNNLYKINNLKNGKKWPKMAKINYIL